jgi:hypothetical protein
VFFGGIFVFFGGKNGGVIFVFFGFFFVFFGEFLFFLGEKKVGEFLYLVDSFLI